MLAAQGTYTTVYDEALFYGNKKENAKEKQGCQSVKTQTDFSIY